ncbi:peptidoglycan-binding domain-containing protein [Allonocardiopsis opalescens]|uniref:Putative peptidoglycan binding protein n=1 Tax=Allonocardiopsis opalescens TaxID=1144618 RepID=A0A2T0PPL2_9ACTN|nr:peptidoglycan-binding domain-containing protein [Allonocardiopsis opalescens]PRX90817.1 putative peptidoglycan binding protein [Allonocardiopsis opalescens]
MALTRVNTTHGRPGVAVTTTNSTLHGNGFSPISGPAMYAVRPDTADWPCIRLGATGTVGSMSRQISTSNTSVAFATYAYIPTGGYLSINLGAGTTIVIETGVLTLGGVSHNAQAANLFNRPIRIEAIATGSTSTYRFYWTNYLSSGAADYQATSGRSGSHTTAIFTAGGASRGPAFLDWVRIGDTADWPGDGILGPGDVGIDVTRLQQDLIAAGYPLPVFGADGDYGSVGGETDTAVRAFQADAGLLVDGITGPETRAALDNLLNLTRYVDLTGTGATSGIAVIAAAGAKGGAGSGALVGAAQLAGEGEALGPNGAGTITATAATGGTGVKHGQGEAELPGAALLGGSGTRAAAGSGTVPAPAAVAAAGTRATSGSGAIAAVATPAGVGDGDDTIPIDPQQPAYLDLRLVAYEPNGARMGVLPSPLSVEVAAPLNDTPSARVRYSTLAANASWLAQPVEVAVEVDPGSGTWFEPPNSRFLRIARSGDVTDQTGARDYQLPGYAWQLGKLPLYPPPDPSTLVDGKRPFLSATAGEILRTWIDEGHARGALAGLDTDFTTTHDSDGQPWDTVLTIYYAPGLDAGTALLNLAEQGVVDWCTQGRTLRVFNADSELAADLASGPAPVDLRLGRDVVEAPDEGTLEDAVSAVYLQGEAGFSLELDNPSADLPWGRWETYITQGGVSDTGTAILLAEAALERGGAERVQITRAVALYTARWLPWRDYAPGDYILAPGDGGTMAPLRIRQITLTRDQDGRVSGNLVLNDRLIEREIRMARRTRGIVGGATAGGGSGAQPAPDVPAGRTPAAPLGLVVDPQAYIDLDGTARGQITATWGAVTADVAGVALEVDGYELYARINLSGEPWYQLTATEADETTTTWSPLQTGEQYAFKVRAVATTGRKGEFSAVYAVTMPGDATPPPAPSTPVLSTRLGVIRADWDGLDHAGAPMPRDFAYVTVWMSDGTNPPVAVDQLRGAGGVVIVGAPYGEDRTIWFTATDTSGNESAESASGVIATQPLVDTDLIGEVIDGAHIVDGTLVAAEKIVAESITGALIQALAIQAGHIAANAITADKIEAGAVTAQAVAADAITGKIVTGSVIRTAVSGRRVVIDPAWLAEIRFYPSTSTNFSRIYSTDGAFPDEATMALETGENNAGTVRSRLTVAAGAILNRVNAIAGGDTVAQIDATEDYIELAHTSGPMIYGNAAGTRIGWNPPAGVRVETRYGDDGRIRTYGRYLDYVAAASDQAIFTGRQFFATVNSVTLSYGPTMDTAMAPVYGLVTSGGDSGRFFHHKMTEASQDSFTVAFANFTSGSNVSVWVNFWCFRV